MAQLPQPELPPPPRERPWLLPSNRKLRHLQGITIRNLTLSLAPGRSRGKTIDDEALPSTLKSPTKTLALRESKALTYSRSSSDLKSIPTTPTRPARPTKALRRRSTLEWTNASPLTRQKRLEDITAGRMADTFFTLHIEAQTEPVYISEVAEKAMNPNFKFFDLDPCGPGVTRLDKLTVKLWARSETMSDWHFLADYTVHFGSLQFIGKTLGNFRHALPQNCVLFHMTDGIYTSFTDLPVQARAGQELLAPPKENPDGRVFSSSSYDALMRLSTLDDCIQDALITRDRIADEIETILETNNEALLTVEQVPEAEEKLRTVQAAVTAEQRRVFAMRRRRDELKASIQARREKMQAGREKGALIASELPTRKELCKETTEALETTAEDIAGQRRRICEDMLNIYPIDALAGKSLAFTIRGLLLPKSHFDDANPDVTSAALGHTAQVVSMLSPYFSVLLPYPISLHGSTSTIEDPLAMGHNNANNPRTYPLYTKGVVRYRFDYAVFLLNKNIEILSNALGIRPLDIRQTLPNLKYFLYVATAGKGELPARKAGGIKGLLRQDGLGSRKGSMDSTGTASSFGADAKGSTGPLKVDHLSANGTLTGTLKQKTSMLPGSRLRPAD
ncbi:UV radiation resistance-associated gene protein [Didymella exigua CBS 183.55]|uniref:Autophagy-related protein 14 n=1 Tax=Didymella exigua CBS 183.55 TaxID=1150837 RepID=A0A6A5RGY5_9PLEO|nr:UV radiation resistance-associated gene protein [Didymella exigua CBS 183.55]KAF1927591.1 UV radiation resistance-associated gene protein [Didymella exigua CBS 183.55]